MQFVNAATVKIKRAKAWRQCCAENLIIAEAIQDQWPNAKPGYWALIFRRFTELYSGLTAEEAVRAICRGYSSPSAAMAARVIKKRRYVGFA